MGTESMTNAARRAMEQMYIDTCTISESMKSVDKTTHVTRLAWQVLAEDEPCRISFLSFPSNGKTDSADTMTQAVKVFLRPDIVVHPGCRIAVTRNGQIVNYRRSGPVAIYPTHQEIELVREEEHP